MAVVGLVLSVIGAVGVLPVVGGLAFRSQGLRRAHRVLGFRRSLPIDIVLTTSAVEAAGHGAPVKRPLTGYGQVRGVANCARALAAHYPHKEIVIHLSGFVRNRLDRDLISLGGPAKNEITRIILGEILERYRLPQLEFDDISDSIRIITPSGQQVDITNFDPQLEDGVPQVDIFIIAATTRYKPDNTTTRCILCAGFTSYGTGAASEYMFIDLPRLRPKHLVKLLRGGAGRERPTRDFIIVARARFSRGECTDIEPLFESVLTAVQSA